MHRILAIAIFAISLGKNVASYPALQTFPDWKIV